MENIQLFPQPLEIENVLSNEFKKKKKFLIITKIFKKNNVNIRFQNYEFDTMFPC